MKRLAGTGNLVFRRQSLRCVAAKKPLTFQLASIIWKVRDKKEGRTIFYAQGRPPAIEDFLWAQRKPKRTHKLLQRMGNTDNTYERESSE